MSLIALDKESPLGFLFNNAVAGALSNSYNTFQEKRKRWVLQILEQSKTLLERVQRDVFLNNYTFSGLRAILPSHSVWHLYSKSPMHSLWGLKVCHLTHSERCLEQTRSSCKETWTMKGNSPLDSTTDGPHHSLPRLSFKSPWSSYDAIRQRVYRQDFTASIKSLNPSILDGGFTGIFIGQYLQSVTPNLALGLEAVWQRAAMNQGPETPYHTAPNTRVAIGSPALNYKHKGFELLTRESCTPVQLTFAAEMDHYKQAAKIGVAVSIESGDEEVEQQAMAVGGAPPQIPF
ncbi:hypothetical protein DID88_010246 [Monilinia fructigena]|uniref:Uncharacterized protein n=1 Tax=Monilinia fructigena TaxID=38457 RepID=A0A395IL89_9HELO|nr:hypothetical protein DID88_010246 [Monilinia fructigena]